MSKKMELKILDELSAIKMSAQTTKNIAIISITQPNEDDVVFPENQHIKAIFRMKFYDIDVFEERYSEVKAANQSDFDGLKKFVDSLESLKISLLIIHCGSGISRAGAIGAALDEYLHLDYDVWHNKAYFPNLHVFRLVCNELGIEKTEECFDRLFKIRHDSSAYSDVDLAPLYKLEKIDKKSMSAKDRVYLIADKISEICDTKDQNKRVEFAKKILDSIGVDSSAIITDVFVHDRYQIDIEFFCSGKFSIQTGFFVEDDSYLAFDYYMYTKTGKVCLLSIVQKNC